MKTKVLFAVLATLALLLVWIPSASAKAKWSYGNGQADLAVDIAPGTQGAVCGTSVTGLAGEGTGVDPAVTPPPAPSTSGIGVELYVTPAWQDVGGATVVSGGLLLLDGSLIPPLQTVTTAPPTAVNPPDVYYDFQDNPIWEYSEAPFAFSLPGGTPPYANVVVRRVGRSAYFTSIAVDCTTTSLTSSTNPSTGEFGSFTATVKSDTGGAVTHGGVQFLVDGNQIAANVPLDASGQATYAGLISFLTPGSHDVTANYLGAQSYLEYYFATSSDSLTQQVSSTSGDSTPPTIDVALSPVSPGSGSWYRTPVTVTWTVSDAESPGSVIKTGCVDLAIGSDQAKTTYSCSATSDGGSAGPLTVTVGYDATAPTLAPSLPPGASFAVGQPAPAVTPGANDATSGVAAASCGTVDTSSTGVRKVLCTATDNAGNMSSVTRSYKVTDAFLGFTYPSSETLLARGSTIPVTFGLGNYQGTSRVVNATVTATVTARSVQTPAPPTRTACTCRMVTGSYVCPLKLPGKPGHYQIWVWENVGSAAKPRFVVVQNASAVVGMANANPLTITVN